MRSLTPDLREAPCPNEDKDYVRLRRDRPGERFRRRAGYVLVWILGLALLALMFSPIVVPIMRALALEPLTGRATVVDGDTIEIHGQRIRLFGVDAPESGQTCQDAGGVPYRCAQDAAMALEQLLASNRPTRCDPVDVDRYRRVVARCFAGATDVARWLVSKGLAIDYPAYSRGAYAGDEQAAAAGKVGMWRGTFIKPWEWRKAR